jgi:hypothetical protein
MEPGIEGNLAERSSLTVFPNPSMGTFEINGKSLARENHLAIQDLSGRMISFSLTKTSETIWTIKMTNASPGTYLLKLVNKGSGNLEFVSKITISN